MGDNDVGGWSGSDAKEVVVVAVEVETKVDADAGERVKVCFRIIVSYAFDTLKANKPGTFF